MSKLERAAWKSAEAASFAPSSSQNHSARRPTREPHPHSLQQIHINILGAHMCGNEHTTAAFPNFHLIEFGLPFSIRGVARLLFVARAGLSWPSCESSPGQAFCRHRKA